MTVGVIGHYRCAEHKMGEHHPEAPERLSAIQDQLIRSGLDFVVRQIDATPIERKLLELVHDKDYVDYIFANSPTEGTFNIYFALRKQTKLYSLIINSLSYNNMLLGILIKTRI